eukprot:752106-Hanusia_phi.AAC.1
MGALPWKTVNGKQIEAQEGKKHRVHDVSKEGEARREDCKDEGQNGKGAQEEGYRSRKRGGGGGR